ncbi:TonB-dependent receptor [Hyphomicrobium methylovorum]|uniref:TonB-dependent receptor n=1 Tax=Hyphomicrobium methylovorum TaxID=84 RepID=UPI0015E79363|nr:TonB-dependent receptor [Hyphomicrobium methylovorum]MBA2125174.1 TonB-dependent receptor [Hyphomicrobium methylovorum]
MRARASVSAVVFAVGAASALSAALAQDHNGGAAAPQNEGEAAPPTVDGVAQLPAVVVTGQKKKPAAKNKHVAKKKAPASSEPGSATGYPEPTPPTQDAIEQSAPAASAEARYLPPPGSLIAPQTSGNATTITPSSNILPTHGATLTDSLQNQPGVAGSTFAPGANRPILRGLDNSRVRVQENGIATGDVSDISEDHAVPTDPYSADSVTVIRGPATVRYGSNAIGGVVSAENQRIPTEIPYNAISGEIMGGLSSVDNGRDGAFKATAASQGFVVHADGFARHADDYDTPEGKQENSFVDSRGASIGGSYIWRDGFFGVSYTRFDSLYAVPGIESAEEKSRIDMGQDKISAKGEWRAPSLGIAAVRSWFGWTNYAHNELAFEADENADAVASRFTNKYTEARAEIESMPVMTAFGALTSTAGIQISNRKLTGTSFEGDSLLEPNTTDTIGGYFLEELRISKPLRLQAGLRIEHDDVRGTMYDDILDPEPDSLVAQRKSFDPKSGSLGLLYDLPHGIVARLTGQYAERAPVAQELFSKGAHEATGTFEIGNPDIGIETAKSIELGFNKASGRWRFDTSAYYTKYDGYIFRDLTGETCGETINTCGSGDPDNEFKEVIFDQRNATFYGVELASEYDVARIFRGLWGVSGQYDFVHAQFENGEYVPRIAPHRLGGGIYYRDDVWQAKLTSLYAFRQDDIAPHETPTADYTLLNAEVSFTMMLDPEGGVTPKFVIGLKGENLLNEDIRNSASFKKDEVLAPGANVRLFGKLAF